MILTGDRSIHPVIVIKNIISRVGLANVVKMQVMGTFPQTVRASKTRASMCWFIALSVSLIREGTILNVHCMTIAKVANKKL